MKRTLSLLILTLVIALFSSCAATEEKATSATASVTATVAAKSPAEMEKLLIELEKKSWDPVKEHSPEAAKQINAPGFRAVYYGVVKSEEESANDTKDIVIKNISFSDWKVSFPVPNTAIITYQYDAVASYKGKDTSGTYVANSTWVNIGGDWKLAIYADTKAEGKK